jgi:hypothetical protein
VKLLTEGGYLCGARGGPQRFLAPEDPRTLPKSGKLRVNARRASPNVGTAQLFLHLRDSPHRRDPHDDPPTKRRRTPYRGAPIALGHCDPTPALRAAVDLLLRHYSMVVDVEREAMRSENMAALGRVVLAKR